MSKRVEDARSEGIPLAKTLQTIRRELILAQQESAGEGILFRMDRVEVELQVVVSSKTTGEAGIKFYVVNAGGGVERSGETTHTIKLTLTPVDESGNNVLVNTRMREKPSER